MSTNFFPARGCVYSVNTTGNQKGLYVLEGSGNNLLTSNNGKNGVILITGLDMVQSDVVAPVITTEDLKVLYVFGKSFGRVAVIGQVLMGSVTGPPKRLGDLQKWFKENRISEIKKPVKLSVADEGHNVYITGFSLGAIDAEFNIQSFSLEGLMAD